MFSQYLSRRLREPVPRWRWPRREHLLEEVFRRGTPPFDPFPSVQDILDAALCPYASVHKIYHGLHGALRGVRVGREEFDLGNYFHEFIAFLKTEISSGRRHFSEIMAIFNRFCAEKGLQADVENGLRSYLSHWIRRKRGYLEQIWSQRPRMVFEVHVASINVTFERSVRFPLHGIIDELDITNRRLIERTLKGREDDANPPFLKDFQVWLLWKVLKSINRDVARRIFGDEDFEAYELIVETPYRDFRVSKDNPLFNTWAEDAFAWVSDIIRGGSLAASDAWRNRGHHTIPCRFRDGPEECVMANACYPRQRRYPEHKGALRESLRPLYRALANEQLWSHDLLLYQISEMEQDDDPGLRDALGNLLLGRNIYPVGVERSLVNGRFLLRIDEDARTSLQEVIQDEVLSFDVILGSFSFGLRRKVSLLLDDQLSNIREGNFVIRAEGLSDIEGMNAFLIRSGLIFREDPWFLKRITQQCLFDLERWGLDREDRARRHVTVRLIDTLFGPGTLRSRGDIV
ncbi:MAG: hypothetical protein ABIM44_09335 [candidate division WOR-3 bacterium]